MDSELQLELIDLGDAKAETKGPFSDHADEEGPTYFKREE
jgi:hypothetical protein